MVKKKGRRRRWRGRHGESEGGPSKGLNRHSHGREEKEGVGAWKERKRTTPTLPACRSSKKKKMKKKKKKIA